MLDCVPMINKRDSSPFAALAKLRDQLPSGTAVTQLEPPPARGPARAVVRLEKKHRGGKMVTIVEKLDLSKSDLDEWCKALKQALGCGGSVEDRAIVLQGDLRARLVDVLT